MLVKWLREYAINGGFIRKLNETLCRKLLAQRLINFKNKKKKKLGVLN